MKLNYNMTIDGKRVKLVPYRPEHVPIYHNWMMDPQLLEATASEPLSLEDEYGMQASWRDDPKKCTFILLDKAHVDSPGTGSHGGAMAGDVNFFLNDADDASIAELEVMIAEERSRGAGLAYEALTLLMAWAVRFAGICTFCVKIGESNAASLGLFQKLEFIVIGQSTVFKEVHLQRQVDGAFHESMLAIGEGLVIGEYDKCLHVSKHKTSSPTGTDEVQ